LDYSFFLLGFLFLKGIVLNPFSTVFSYKKKITGGYSSIGRTAVCGTVSSLFKSGYPPFREKAFFARIVQ
jgi:hypothetical protein